jgi:hypothetical protein
MQGTGFKPRPTPKKKVVFINLRSFPYNSLNCLVIFERKYSGREKYLKRTNNIYIYIYIYRERELGSVDTRCQRIC